MSIWSSLNGEIKVHKHHKISIKRIVEVMFDEFGLNVSTRESDAKDYFYHSFELSFSDSGMNARILGEEFIKHLHDRGAVFIELEMTIRYY